jgi:hypothetical protein
MGDDPADLHILRPRVHPRLQRRRELAHSQHIPAELASPFTEGEMAVLKIIADEHVRCGACTLSKDAIGALSSTSHTVVKCAIHNAETAGLIKREQGHRRGRPYTTITIISAKWKAWLDRYGDAPPDGPR